MLSADDFPRFFRALHGYPPFPWQERLARDVLLTGWPGVLDLPTGSGKTAALDVAVFAMAIDAANPPDERRMPRRVFLIVDRRVIVDQAFERAEKIASLLLKSLTPGTDEATRDNGVLHTAASQLLALTETGAPLVPALLRGGMERDDGWARRPDQPMIGCSTVDQVGSRLLFRGYGPSSRSSSVHAGLVGNDVLFLLDEVHLSRPFANTLRQVGGSWSSPLPRRWQVVEMSATPDAEGDSPFGLRQEDHDHPVLAERLRAAKPATLEVVKTSVRSSDRENRTRVAEHILKLLPSVRTEHAAIGVMVNRVDTARQIALGLADDERCDVILVTGRMRPMARLDLGNVFERITTKGSLELEVDRPTLDRPLIVVATQTLEAGADLDFDALVTECASFDSLVQRFGRLNRSGRRLTARGWIVVRKDQLTDDDPIYGESLGATATWLKEQESLDFGYQRLPTPLLACQRPPTQQAMWRQRDLEQWSLTHPRPVPDPDITVHLHGVERGAPEVQIVWRDDLLVGPDDALRWRAALDLRPPTTLEAVAVPLWAARKWLAGKPSDTSVGDVESGRSDGERLRAPLRPFIRWKGSQSERSTEPRPGDTLVVPSTYGGLDAKQVWSPSDTTPVPDVGDRAQWERFGQTVLRRPEQEWPEELSEADIRVRFADKARTEPWLSQALEHALKPGRRANWMWVGEAIVSRHRQKREAPTTPFTTGDDTSSYSLEGRSIGLAHHLRDVRDNARTFGRSLGLAPEVVADVALAAALHDVGKADPRFQRMLAGADPLRAAVTEPLAKSGISSRDFAERRRLQRLAGYPLGTRHEILSVALCEGNPALLRRAHDPDLVLHLVGSHHGFCRPFAPPVEEPDALMVEVQTLDGDALQATTQHHLARLGSGIATRFHRLQARYGIHGLAWLECIVRLADHRASESPSPKETPCPSH
jgi:CRISPR-associated endonuclease/helicase Cas3